VQEALMVAVCVFFLSALLFLLAARTLRDDLYDAAAAAQRSA